MPQPPPLFFLDIPHIFDSVFDHLPFADLHRCIFVCRSWHDALICRLWQDVVNLRHERKEERFIKSTYTYNFLTPDSHHPLFKYAHHIRALTWRGDLQIPVLIAANVTNLEELNFIVGEKFNLLNGGPSPVSIYCSETRDRSSPHLVLGDLDKLIAANPSLRSVSIEDLDLHSKRECLALERFVESLDAFPSITCLYLSGWLCGIDNKAEYESSLIAIMERRLALIDKSSIKTLKFRDREYFTRSKRGLPGQEEDATGRRWAGGRWESESSGEIHTVVAVLENNGVLEISMPYQEDLFIRLSVTLSTRFPALQHLDMGLFRSVYPRVLQVLPASCPNLRTFVMPLNKIRSDDVETFMMDPRMKLSSLTLKGIGPITYAIALRPSLLQPTNFLCHALVKATFNRNSSLSSLLEVLALCPNLHSLLTSEVIINGSEPDISPVWACRRLQVLNLRLVLKGSLFTFHDHNKEALALAENSAAKLASTFMQQLGQQFHLRELHLVDSHRRYTTFQFIRLSLENSGMKHLAELRQLESIMFTGDVKSIGGAEVEWMSIHWPHLKSIQLYSSKPDFCKDSAFEELLLASWRPELKTTAIFHPR